MALETVLDVRVPAAPATPVAAVADVITIVVADAQALFREALRHLIDTQPALRVVAETDDGREALRLVRTLRPAVLLMDLDLPGLSALDVLAQLSQVQGAPHTLIVTDRASDGDVVEAMQMGARGVVMKHSATNLLFKSIRSVVAGQYWVGRDNIGGLIEQMRTRGRAAAGTPWAYLTSRELELVGAVMDGCANNDIASLLKIRPKTVKHHLTKIFSKLGVSNRLELALFAVHHQFRSPRFH